MILTPKDLKLKKHECVCFRINYCIIIVIERRNEIDKLLLVSIYIWGFILVHLFIERVLVIISTYFHAKSLTFDV